MKKSFITTVILLFVLGQIAHAAYLKNAPQKLHQPNGDVVHCFATGDEYYHWLHDAQGFTIIKNTETSYFVYADLQDDQLVPTQLIPGIDNPVSGGLSPGLNISAEKVRAIRQNKFQIPNLKGTTGTNNVGTLNNIVVFIRFNDQSEFTTPKSYYDNSFNGTSQVSMYEYFKEVSNDQLSINTTFYPAGGATVVSYQDAQDRTYYQPYDQNTNTNGYSTDDERTTREHNLLKTATESLAAAIQGTGLDFDMDNDGYVDNIAYIIQGATDGWSELLWPHMWALYSHNVQIGSLRVWTYNFQLSDAFGVSVLCHEMFHSLGAPDLYRYDNDDITPVGPWDIMANNRTPPQHMSAYMKMKYGKWFNEIPEITTEGSYQLNPLATDPFAAYKIASPNSSEFFVVEYRRATGRFESSVPGSGLIIYRVNGSLNGNAHGPPDEIYVYRPNGTITNSGSLYSAHFSQNDNRTAINDGTNPASFLSDGSAGGLNISNISSTGSTMSFDVSFTTVGFNPPDNLTATAGTDYADLSWDLPQAGSPTLLGFNIFRNGQFLTSLYDPTATNYQDINLAPGSYIYNLTALYSNPDGESESSNDASIDIIEYKADLLVQNISLSHSDVDAGNLVEVTGLFTNSGNLDAGACTGKFFLGLNTNPLEGELLETVSIPALVIGEQADFTVNLSIPDEYPTGNYFVMVLADSEEEIEETDESNNLAFRSLGIRASFADLIIGRVTTEQSTAIPGELIDIAFDWQNGGNRIAGAHEVIIYWSADQYYDSEDVPLYDASYDALSPGNQNNLSTTITIPVDASAGTHFLVVYVDPNDEVPESNENNNEEYTAIELLTLPDIALFNLSTSSQSIKDGRDISLSFEVSNIGGLPSAAFDVWISIGQSSTIEPAYLQLKLPISALNAGESMSPDIIVTVPPGTIAGEYFLQVYIDPGMAEDADESNNYIFRQFEVLNYPDLQIGLTAEENQFKPYHDLDFQLELSNYETGSAISFDLRVVLSQDQVVDDQDELLQDLNNLSLTSNQVMSLPFSNQFKDDIAPGMYYVLAEADPAGMLEETNESNNLASLEIEILDISSAERISTHWSIKSYPNPTSDQFIVEYQGREYGTANLRLMNRSGQTVFQQSIYLQRQTKVLIPDLHLAEGLYFIQIFNADIQWHDRVLVIK